MQDDHLYADEPRTASGAAAAAALQTLSRRLKEADERALRLLGVGPLDARALLHIVQSERNGAVVRPSDLVVELHVTSAAVTKLVDRLVTAGHLDRLPNPRDRRGVILVPAGAVAAELDDVYRRIHGPLVDVVDAFPDAELEVIARFASRLSDALREATRDDDDDPAETASIPMSLIPTGQPPAPTM